MKTLKFFTCTLVLFVLSGVYCINAQNPVHVLSITQNLQSPVRLAIDQNDIIYVTDATQKNIEKYDFSDNFLGIIEPGGSPISIAINDANEIFIGDSETGVISKLDSNGVPSVFYTGVIFPSSMTFSPNGLLYIVDSQLQNVIALDQSGSIVQTIGTGTLIYPVGITYDIINNRILISEHGGVGTGFYPIVKIWIFDLQGNVISSFGSHGSGDGQFYRIQGLTVGKCGAIFVPDPFQGNVSMFNENGEFITKFGEYGDNSGQLNLPLDIFTDSQDRVLITSMNNGAIEIFDVSNMLPTANISSGNVTICSNESASIPVHFTGIAPWTLTYTVDGINPASVSGITDSLYSLYVYAEGVYEIESVSDSNYLGTCFSGSFQVSLNPAPIPQFSYTTNNLEVNFTNNSLNSDTYLWNFGDSTTSSDINPVHNYLADGNYVVSLTATNSNCGDSTISFNILIINVQNNYFNLENNISVYPNPSKGNIIIENRNSVQSDFSIEVSNAIGQVLFVKKLNSLNKLEYVNLTDFSKGIYYLKLISSNSTKTTKLILIN